MTARQQAGILASVKGVRRALTSPGFVGIRGE